MSAVKRMLLIKRNEKCASAMYYGGIRETGRVHRVPGVSRTPAGYVGPSFRCTSGARTDVQADSAITSVITSVSPRICANTAGFARKGGSRLGGTGGCRSSAERIPR